MQGKTYHFLEPARCAKTDVEANLAEYVCVRDEATTFKSERCAVYSRLGGYASAAVAALTTPFTFARFAADDIIGN